MGLIMSRLLQQSYLSLNNNSDPADKAAIDEAERHALAVIPEGSSLLTFFIYALIPESIRFALNITVYGR